jgi:hypothetical protein
VGFCNFILIPFAGAPVKTPTLANQPVERPADLLHGDICIGSMAKDDIHILKVQSLQGISQTFNYVLSRKTASIRDIFLFSPKDFRGKDEMVSGEVEGVQGDSDLSFSFSVA